MSGSWLPLIGALAVMYVAVGAAGLWAQRRRAAQRAAAEATDPSTDPSTEQSSAER